MGNNDEYGPSALCTNLTLMSFPASSHQVLRAALLQVVQLPVHVRQVLVDGVQLRLQVFVLLVVAVKIALVVIALPFVCDSGIFAELWKQRERGMDKKKKRKEIKLPPPARYQLSSFLFLLLLGGSSRDDRVDVLPTCQSRRRPARRRTSCSRRSRASFWAFRTSSRCPSLCCRELHYAEARSPPSAGCGAKNGDRLLDWAIWSWSAPCETFTGMKQNRHHIRKCRFDKNTKNKLLVCFCNLKIS